MVQSLTYVFLVFVLLFRSIFPVCGPLKKTTAPETGSLAATDALGRQAVTAGESEKKVGVFYFLWHEHGWPGPYNISEIAEAHPDAVESEEKWMQYGGGGYGAFHYWDEPLLGYYDVSDKWVLSRHCQMLTDAAVDFIVFDATNGYAYLEAARSLIDVWYGYYEQGRNVPQLAFYTNAGSGNVINLLYDELYNNEAMRSAYPKLDELWFRLNGRPMIVGNADDENLRSEVKDYFRIKEVQWPTDSKHSDGFPWMEFGTTLLTVGGYYKNSFKDESIMNVSVAQHCDTCRFSASAWYGGSDHGRSWHNGAKDTSEDAVLKGYNFAEQWEFALKLDPDIIFITGFNEWAAQRLRFADDEPIGFCDNCTVEYSRGLEPSAGILGDNYYMQMVNYIARFKGTTAVLPHGGEKTIDVSGDFAQWDAVSAVYRDYRGDTAPRDCLGVGDTLYTDDSGRNDIVTAKVCEDAEKLYFYVETADALSPCTDDAWMTLFVNVSGKEGYDYCINRTSPEDGKAPVEAVRDGGYERLGDADIRFEGSRLMLSVEKSLFGSASGENASFTFKWADNYVDGDIYSFYTKGDSAPYGRLNWVY
ncbi:MAG: hypothetical protein K6C36_07900 [Clostridia bacterium]|nr:hypothetical protein [Clostridia bacterium]